jgi:aquaporin NIP
MENSVFDKHNKKHLKMKKYIAEFIGTFALVFAGTGAIIINEQTQGVIGHVGIAMTFGVVIGTMIFAIGNISGCHINPAVSIAFTVAGKFPIKELIAYVIAQLAGAFVASLAHKNLFPANELLGTCIPAGTDMQAFILETILTFFLVFVIMNVAHGSKEQGMFAGIAIGGAILLDALFAGPITGASMNPARSIAPAVVSGHLEHLWVYIAAPILGGIIAVLAYKVIKPAPAV